MAGKTVSHYWVAQKVRQGRMGEVFLAHDTSINPKLDLKFCQTSCPLRDGSHGTSGDSRKAGWGIPLAR